MSQAGKLVLVSTDPATQFRAAQNQNVAVGVSLPMGDGMGFNTQTGLARFGTVDGGVAAGKTVNARVKTVTIVSVQLLDWEIWLFGTNTFNGSLTDPGAVFPMGVWNFGTADAKRFGGAGLYYYVSDNNDLPYQDLQRQGNVNLLLVNRNATPKAAGDAGMIRIQLGMEPTQGW